MTPHKTLNYKAVGKRLSEVRQQKNMTQSELAIHAGITQVYLSNMENAHSHASLATFVKVANALGTGVDVLLCDTLHANRTILDEHLAMLTQDCTAEEMKLIIGTLRGLKEQMRTVKFDV